MSEARFEVFEREDGKWDWRLVAANEEIVATSGGQGFRDAPDARRAIRDASVIVRQAEQIVTLVRE